MEVHLSIAKRKIMKRIYTCFGWFLFILLFFNYASNAQELLSPDKKIKISISLAPKVTYEVFYEEKQIVAPSLIDLILADGRQLLKSSASKANPKKIITSSNNSV